MGKKFRTEKDPETGFLRVIALKDFSDVKKGDKGGLIGKESSLSQKGKCWVYEGACIGEYAYVSENAKIYGGANVYGDAWVHGNAEIFGFAEVYGNAQVFGDAEVYGGARVIGNAQIYGNAEVFEKAQISGYVEVYEKAKIYGNVYVLGEASVEGVTKICGNVKLHSPVNRSFVSLSIKDSKDYVILAIKKDFYIITLSNNIINQDISIVEENYLKNIQTIRQLYGKEV